MKTSDSTPRAFSSILTCLVVSAFLVGISSHARAVVIDPEKDIMKNGYHSAEMGDDGKTQFYSFTERADPSRISALEADIAALPKQVEVQKACDSMRGSTKALLIEQSGIAFDVALTNYGYSGSTIACVLKYMNENKVGTRLIFVKKGQGGMYVVLVTD